MSKIKVRTPQLKQNQIVVCRKPGSVEEKEFDLFVHALAGDIHNKYPHLNVVIVGLEEWREMQLLDEDQMERYGWVRLDRVFLLKEDVDLTQYTSEQLEEIIGKYAFPTFEEEE